MKLPDNLTMDQVLAAANEAVLIGFCLTCGAEVSGVEPDAEEYTCPFCAAEDVYGAEQILIFTLF